MPTKTYETHRQSLSLTPAKPGARPLFFTNGLLVVDSAEDQAFIEGLPAFKDEVIVVRPASFEVDQAVAKAKSLRGVADKAAAAAKDAEDEVAALKKAPAKA